LHTSHAFQPLDVLCFKPFKTTFKKERNASMAKIKYQEPNIIKLVNIRNMGSIIKATNDRITTQQGEH
jgi:hypothetical protein